MKKFCLLIALAFGVVLASSSPSLGFGVCLDDDYWCNDYFLTLGTLGSDIYVAHGYEYGCGYQDREVTGSANISGGYIYFGLTKNTTGYSDYGMLGFSTTVIELSTMTGPGMYNYVYLSGGVLTGHGGTIAFST